MANPEAAVREQDLLYALDIGTRTVIGLVGVVEEERVRILDAETRPHASRAMLDGQIEDIDQVAAVVSQVTRALEKRVGAPLRRVCVAAAGRSLRTEQGHSTLELPAPQAIGPELVLRLEAEAVSHAEQAIQQAAESQGTRLFLVGYSTTQFSIDRSPMPKPIGHTGQQLEADVVATFLPSEVVDSLYAVLRAASLEVASLTLEPIAALNAAIPADLRLLNLALVDIGAGTSDIAVCRDGSVVGYTMATTAGDEITEALMRSCLVDYPTAESIKARLSGDGEITYQDILGLEQVQNTQQLRASVEPAVQALAGELAERITALNGGPPSAVFLAGGGSKLSGLNARLAAALGLDEKRIAVAGRYFQTSAVSDAVELDDPVYTTPLGIAISAGLGLISDSYRIQLNGAPAKLFRGSGVSAMELLMMNGYRYSDFIGRSGRPLSRLLLQGGQPQPAVQPERLLLQRPFQGVFPVRRCRKLRKSFGAGLEIGDELRTQTGGVAVRLDKTMNIRADNVAPAGGKKIGIGLIIRLAAGRPSFVVDDDAFRDDAQRQPPATQGKTEVHVLITIAIAFIKAAAGVEVRAPQGQTGSRDGLQRMRAAQRRMTSRKAGIEMAGIAEEGKTDAAVLIASVRVE